MVGTAMKNGQLLLCIFLFGFWGGMKVRGMVCYIGNEPDTNGTMKWVLPYRDPCECTEIRLGSVNTQYLPRSFTPKYFSLSTLEMKNLTAVIDLLHCTRNGPKCQIFGVSEYQYHYKFAPLPDGRVFVKFSVRIEHDAHISLVRENKDLPDMYEIVIGGWDDTKSVIRKSKQGHNNASIEDRNGWLDGQIYKYFWVNATLGTSQDGTETMTISVGRGSDENPYMSFTDPCPLPVRYLGFSGWYGTSGSYKFCDP